MIKTATQNIDVVGAATAVTAFGVGISQVNEILTAIALIVSIVAGALTIWYRFRKK